MIKLNKFFFPYIILLIIIGFNGTLAISFLVVSLHEIVHYLTAVSFGYSGFDLRILPIGTVLNLKDLDEATPKQDIIISISGPIFNLLLAAVMLILNKNTLNHSLIYFIQSNLALGLFNLIPAFPLDGGRILRDCLSLKTFYKRANELTIKISILIGCFMIVFFIFLCILHILNYNIGIIGIFVVVSSYKEKERIVYIIMGDIIKKKSKFLKNKYIENKSVSIYYKGDLISVLSLCDKSKYNIFTVLDEELKVLDIIYEEDVVKGLKEYGNITIEEFVEIRENNDL